jgi:hypothetical protein
MIFKFEHSLVIACLFIWIGFVCGISFLEAWLKFRAPGVTMQVGLGIGRLVFNTLNKVEWVFALLILGVFIWKRQIYLDWSNIYFLLALLILIVQTIWLLPLLDQRAEEIIEGKQIAPSHLHIYFVFGESIKVVSLCITGLNLFK